jgi:hypothetical protein
MELESLKKKRPKLELKSFAPNGRTFLSIKNGSAKITIYKFNLNILIII